MYIPITPIHLISNLVSHFRNTIHQIYQIFTLLHYIKVI